MQSLEPGTPLEEFEMAVGMALSVSGWALAEGTAETFFRWFGSEVHKVGA